MTPEEKAVASIDHDREQAKAALATATKMIKPAERNNEKAWKAYQACADDSPEVENLGAEYRKATDEMFNAHAAADLATSRIVALDSPAELERRVSKYRRLAGLRERNSNQRRPTVASNKLSEKKQDEIIEKIVALSTDEGLSANAIMRRLNDDKVKTFAGGDQWYMPSVRNILIDKLGKKEYDKRKNAAKKARTAKVKDQPASATVVLSADEPKPAPRKRTRKPAVKKEAVPAS